MIIDCHGHYTTAPRALKSFREKQVAALDDPKLPPLVANLKVSDDEIRETIEANQLRIQRERGVDLTIFSPQAGGMAHHVGNEITSINWTRACNDMIHRVSSLYPDSYVGVCQLPQSPGASPAGCVAELRRCVEELGFVGCNLNPDPSGGYWKDPPLTDRYWYPLYEKMVELDVPAMVHVSSSCNPAFHYTGAHYINGDTTAFMQFLLSDIFKDFPTLRFIIPHGGGAVPYHWGRYRGLAQDLKRPAHARASEERLVRHVRLPPARYRAAVEGDTRGEHTVRFRDRRCGQGNRPGDGLPLRRHEALHRRDRVGRARQPRENLQRQRAQGLPTARCAPEKARRRALI
jgi:4-oxalmesaconate hydratase